MLDIYTKIQKEVAGNFCTWYPRILLERCQRTMNDVSTVVQHTKQVLREHKSQFILVLLVEFMVLFPIRCVEFEIILQFMCTFFEDLILLEYYTVGRHVIHCISKDCNAINPQGTTHLTTP